MAFFHSSGCMPKWRRAENISMNKSLFAFTAASNVGYLSLSAPGADLAAHDRRALINSLSETSSKTSSRFIVGGLRDSTTNVGSSFLLAGKKRSPRCLHFPSTVRSPAMSGIGALLLGFVISFHAWDLLAFSILSMSDCAFAFWMLVVHLLVRTRNVSLFSTVGTFLVILCWAFSDFLCCCRAGFHHSLDLWVGFDHGVVTSMALCRS